MSSHLSLVIQSHSILKLAHGLSLQSRHMADVFVIQSHSILKFAHGLSLQSRHMADVLEAPSLEPPFILEPPMQGKFFLN